MAEKKSDEVKAAEESAEGGVQEGRKPGDPAQVEQNPMDDHGAGDAAADEAAGAGPSGGAPTGDTGGGDSEATGAGPSGGA